MGQARAWIDATQANLAAQERPLDAFELREARRAFALLPPGASLVEVVKAHIHHNRPRESSTVADAVEIYLDSRENDGLRGRSLETLRQRLRRFAQDTGDTIVGEMTPRDVLAWFNGAELRGQTRKGYRSVLATFWRWCVEIQQIATENPVARIPVPRQDRTLATVWPWKVARLVIRAARTVAPEIVPYLAVGFFAGIRPAEMMRLEWPAVNGEHIHIGPAVAKTRSQRFVTIQPNLAAWLKEYRQDRGPLCPLCSSARWAQLKAVRTRIGVAEWPHDVMRHSFASYHLAAFQNAPRTSLELGHTEPETLYTHYRNLATEADARAFFGIIPGPGRRVFVQNLYPEP